MIDHSYFAVVNKVLPPWLSRTGRGARALLLARYGGRCEASESAPTMYSLRAWKVDAPQRHGCSGAGPSTRGTRRAPKRNQRLVGQRVFPRPDVVPSTSDAARAPQTRNPKRGCARNAWGPRQASVTQDEDALPRQKPEHATSQRSMHFEVNVRARGHGGNAREGGLVGLGYSLPPGAADSSPSPVRGLTRHSHYKCRGVIESLKANDRSKPSYSFDDLGSLAQ